MTDKTDTQIIEELTGALQFILAFYSWGPQTYLDTKAWEQAQRTAELAYIRGATKLQWTRRQFPWEIELAMASARKEKANG